MNATVSATSINRRVTRQVRGMPTSDGAGVRLIRVIGTPQLPDLDPFLMLDEVARCANRSRSTDRS